MGTEQDMILISVLKDQQRAFVILALFLSHNPFPSISLLLFPPAFPPSTCPTLSPIVEVNVRRNRDLCSPPSALESNLEELAMAVAGLTFEGHLFYKT